MAVKRTSPTGAPAPSGAGVEELVDAPAGAEPEPDYGGWFCNATTGELTAMGSPSKMFAPGEVAFLPYTPSHAGLIPAAEPDGDPPANPAQADVPLAQADAEPPTPTLPKEQ